MKPTSGLWTFSGMLANQPTAIMAGKIQVAHVLAHPEVYGNDGISQEQADANARLIAAAPELFQIIQQTHRFLRNNNFDMTEINAVLDKIDRQVRL